MAPTRSLAQLVQFPLLYCFGGFFKCILENRYQRKQIFQEIGRFLAALPPPPLPSASVLCYKLCIVCNATHLAMLHTHAFVTGCHSTWFPRSGNWLWSLTLKIWLASLLILVQVGLSESIWSEKPLCMLVLFRLILRILEGPPSKEILEIKLA